MIVTFVLLMTWPYLLLWRNGECKKYHLHNASKFCGSRSNQRCMGFVGFSLAFGDSFMASLKPKHLYEFYKITLSPHHNLVEYLLLFAHFNLNLPLLHLHCLEVLQKEFDFKPHSIYASIYF